MMDSLEGGLIRLFLIVFLSSSLSVAEVIEFDASDLATETVLPIFDDPRAVIGRNVLLEGKMELGMNLGLSLIEPLHNPAVFGFNLNYHFDETGGIAISFINYLGGLASYGDQLSQPDKSDLKISFLPEPKFVALANYQYSIYYGKMSISKQSIMNLHLYGLAGGGLVGFDQALPALSGGVGQKFYFSENIAMRFDLLFVVYQGPNFAKVDLKNLTGPRGSADFPQELKFASFMNGGLVYLF